jgi:hypothetical protein
MTGWSRTRKHLNSLAAPLLLILAAGMMACGPTYLEIPIETPIKPKLDVSPFQRVLVAGFVAGGTDDVDANQETVRLLKSKLRNNSQLRVIDADVMPLAEVAQNQNKAANGAAAAGTTPNPGEPAAAGQLLPQPIKDEKDIEPYERLFANTAYWKQIGEEYQNPLIVTGTVLFMEWNRQNMVTRQNERLDAFGQRQVTQDRVLTDSRGYVLRPKFVFIDGRTGATIDTETHREEIVYPSQQNMPPLSSYFELMDRLLPNFLTALSSQKIRGTRVLLK